MKKWVGFAGEANRYRSEKKMIDNGRATIDKNKSSHFQGSSMPSRAECPRPEAIIRITEATKSRARLS